MQIVQQFLNRVLNSEVAVDGKIGPETIKAIDDIGRPIDQSWSEQKKVIGAVQFLANKKGFEAGPVDGLWGPQTEHGYDQLKQLGETGKYPDSWRVEEGADGSTIVGGDQWPLQTQEQLFDFYGDVGENQVTMASPYPMKLAWDTDKTIKKFKCHKLVKESFQCALEQALDHYTLDGIKDLRLDLWGGTLNVRKIRGGDVYSTHAWGIALDIDPAHNKLKWDHTKASLAKPEYEQWHKIWEQLGWVNLGRTKDYDYMHYQAARVKI